MFCICVACRSISSKAPLFSSCGFPKLIESSVAIYVDDMVEAMFLAATRLDGYAAINIGLGKGHSVRELLGLITELDGYPDAKIKYDPSKPTMIPIRLIDTRKAESLLGFRAQVDIREGLRRTIEWYRASRGISRP